MKLERILAQVDHDRRTIVSRIVTGLEHSDRVVASDELLRLSNLKLLLLIDRVTELEKEITRMKLETKYKGVQK